MLFDQPLPVVLEYGLKLQMARALVVRTASSVKSRFVTERLRPLQQLGRPGCSMNPESIPAHIKTASHGRALQTK